MVLPLTRRPGHLTARAGSSDACRGDQSPSAGHAATESRTHRTTGTTGQPDPPPRESRFGHSVPVFPSTNFCCRQQTFCCRQQVGCWRQQVRCCRQQVGCCRQQNFVAANKLGVAVNKLFVAANKLGVAANKLFVAVNKLDVAANKILLPPTSWMLPSTSFLLRSTNFCCRQHFFVELNKILLTPTNRVLKTTRFWKKSGSPASSSVPFIPALTVRTRSLSRPEPLASAARWRTARSGVRPAGPCGPPSDRPSDPGSRRSGRSLPSRE